MLEEIGAFPTVWQILAEAICHYSYYSTEQGKPQQHRKHVTAVRHKVERATHSVFI